MRRLNILEALRRSGAREILILSGTAIGVPTGIADLWTDGFRSYLTIASDAVDSAQSIQQWLEQTSGVGAVNFVRSSASDVVNNVLERFQATYPDERHVLRIRDVNGRQHKIDVTDTDEPERPILANYGLIEEKDLTPVMPDELTEQEFVSFFKNSADSWRPYAAGLPWRAIPSTRSVSRICLRRLDDVGPESNCIAYISSEPGAGGSTLARTLAWEVAQQGYPVLVAKPIPFAPDALPVVNYLTRVHRVVVSLTDADTSRKHR